MRLTVRMRHPLYDVKDRYSRSVYIPFYRDYTGDVVPAPRWASDKEFMITTGDKDAPFRILHKDSIICGWLLPPSSRDTDPVFVSIPGKSGRSYVVTLADTGELSCNCNSFGYRRTCSHVQEVEEAEV